MRDVRNNLRGLNRFFVSEYSRTRLDRLRLPGCGQCLNRFFVSEYSRTFEYAAGEDRQPGLNRFFVSEYSRTENCTARNASCEEVSIASSSANTPGRYAPSVRFRRGIRSQSLLRQRILPDISVYRFGGRRLNRLNRFFVSEYSRTMNMSRVPWLSIASQSLLRQRILPDTSWYFAKDGSWTVSIASSSANTPGPLGGVWFPPRPTRSLNRFFVSEYSRTK